ncbi:MAG: hypothetical protein SPF41_01695 [Candidatus Merdousia sp.]|nr:hypothetical protein [Candidatus Merdousia sp.]
MKKYLILLSALAATAAFAEKGSADKGNPTKMSTWSSFGGGTTAGVVTWHGNGGNTPTDMTDSYVIADKDLTLKNFQISGTGGDHCNLNLDLNGKTLTFTNHLVNYNDTLNESTGLSSSYSLGLKFTNSDSQNEATMNFTSSRVTIRLETTDTASGGLNIRNRYGRTVYIGEGITAKIQTLDVIGRFKNLSDPSKMEFDSKMTVAGKVNVANTMTLSDTNFENTGTVSATTINIFGSNFTSSGSILSSGLSAYENSNIVLGGSNLAKDGTSQGTVRFYGKNNTLTASSDLAAQYLVMKTATTSYEAAELTIKGDFTTDRIVMEDNTQLTIDSGAKTTFDFSNKNLDDKNTPPMTIRGDITVKGMLDIKTKGSMHASEFLSYKNILVDGGSLINTTATNSSYAFNIYDGKTITLKNGGTINTSTNSFIGLTGGKLIVDATSKILAPLIMFSQSKGTLELSHASNLASNTNICVKDISDNADAKIVLTDCGEAYFIKNLRALRNSQLTIDLNGAELNIASVGGYEPAKGTNLTLTLLDFENGLVKVDGWTSELISSGEFEISPETSGNTNTIKLVAYDKAGTLLDGLWSVDASGYLANSAIPEPAEWAAIFGAIALGLAVYRRRK